MRRGGTSHWVASQATFTRLVLIIYAAKLELRSATQFIVVSGGDAFITCWDSISLNRNSLTSGLNVHPVLRMHHTSEMIRFRRSSSTLSSTNSVIFTSSQAWLLQRFVDRKDSHTSWYASSKSRRSIYLPACLDLSTVLPW